MVLYFVLVSLFQVPILSAHFGAMRRRVIERNSIHDHSGKKSSRAWLVSMLAMVAIKNVHRDVIIAGTSTELTETNMLLPLVCHHRIYICAFLYA